MILCDVVKIASDVNRAPAQWQRSSALEHALEAFLQECSGIFVEIVGEYFVSHWQVLNEYLKTYIIRHKFSWIEFSFSNFVLFLFLWLNEIKKLKNQRMSQNQHRIFDYARPIHTIVTRQAIGHSRGQGVNEWNLTAKSIMIFTSSFYSDLK